jgi:hypothetical protein
MSAINQDDTFYQNNGRTFEFTIFDRDSDVQNALLDVTDIDIFWTLSRLNDDGTWNVEPVLVKNSGMGGGIIKTDAPNGLVDVILDAMDTAKLLGKYYMQLEIISSTGVPVVVSSGIITLLRNTKNSL